MLEGEPTHLVHVDHLRVGVDPVGDEVVVEPAEVDRRAVGEMTALIEPHPENRVPRLQQREVGAHVGLGPGMGLDVGELGAEQLLGPIDGQLLHLVDDLTAFVIATTRIALGVLVGEHRARCRHDRRGGEVLRGDQVDVAVLAFQVFADQSGDRRIDLFDGVHGDHGPEGTVRG